MGFYAIATAIETATSPSAMTSFSFSSPIFLFGGVAILIQLLSFYMTAFFIRRRSKRLDVVRKKYQYTNEMMTFLDESITHIKMLETVHLLNVNPQLSIEVERLLVSRWDAIHGKFHQCLALGYGDRVKFAILSVRGAFDLYHQTQQEFLGHSSRGQKVIAQELLSGQGEEILLSLRHLLEAARKCGAESLRSELRIAVKRDRVRAVYPSLAAIVALAVFFGKHVLTS